MLVFGLRTHRFSDVDYGEQRYTRGMDTNWVLGGVPGTRALYVHFDINRLNFSAFTDVRTEQGRTAERRDILCCVLTFGSGCPCV